MEKIIVNNYNGWMSSLNRKKHQRRLNRYIKRVNKMVSDDVFGNRFYIHQRQSFWHPYEDRSGGDLWVEIEVVDRKTGNYKSYYDTDNYLCYFNGNRLFKIMNDFIINSDFWEEYRDKNLKNL